MKPDDVSRTRERPLIISVGVTGSITGPDQTAALPITPEEIADSALEAWAAGASVAHIHVREDDGTPSNRAELYERVFQRIRGASDMLICATTGSGGGRFEGTERLTALGLQPEIASFDAGSMNFGRRVFVNSPDFLDQLAHEIRQQGILPEIECFDIGMVANALRSAADWGFPSDGQRWWFQFCLGVRGGAPATANTLMAMRNELPPNALWSVLGIGSAQLRVAHIALVEGGHIRVGLEDNIYYRRGELATSNAQLVSRIVEMARNIDRPVADPATARAMLGLPD